MAFTVNTLIDQLIEINFFQGEEFSQFDKIEIGIRAARSFYCLHNTKDSNDIIEPKKTQQTLPNGYQLQVNEYPDDFRYYVIRIANKYIKSRQKGNLISTFDWKKQQAEYEKSKGRN